VLHQLLQEHTVTEGCLVCGWVVPTISNDKRHWKLPRAFYVLLGLDTAVATTSLGIATYCTKRYDVT